MLSKYISKEKLLLIAILLVAFTLRTYGINWDQNHHLHPDERFLTMVATTSSIPSSFSDYLDPTVSTLNPYNLGEFNFFVYGTFPVTLTKVVAAAVNMDSYDGIVLVGRLLSAIFDVGTLLFVYLIAMFLEKRYQLTQSFKYIAAFLYAITVLPIQNAHFFTTDSVATFFILSSIYFALRYYDSKLWPDTFMSAVFFGCALGSKISSVFVAPLIGAFFILGALPAWKDLRKNLSREIPGILGKLVVHGALYGVVAYVMLRVSDPRFFATGNWFVPLINPQFLDNIQELQRLTSRDTIFPPSIQWLSKKPLLFPLQNVIVFGLGIPYFIAVLVGSFQLLKKKYPEILVIVGWMVVFFAYQGTRLVTTMRYFYVLYPFMAILAAWALARPFQTTHADTWKRYFVPVLFTLLVWPMSFMHTYTQPHAYVQASEWIYANIPEGAVIASEHWNDYLPLNIPEDENTNGQLASQYDSREIPAFYPDSSEKSEQIQKALDESDYYILVNNRSYAAIGALPERFPDTSAFYKELLKGQRGYEIVAEFTTYPTVELGFAQIEINDQWAEEAFTVYDHPRVIILKNISK